MPSGKPKAGESLADLLEDLLVVTPIKAIDVDVSQNGYDSSELHRIDPEATMRRILANRGL